jgi:hypothetical protein
VHFHDADDLFAPGWCDQVRDRLEAAHPDALFTEVAWYQDGNLLQGQVLGLEELRRSQDLLRFCIRGALLPASGTYLRERVAAIGGYSTDYWQSEDYEFHIRLARSGVRFELICHPLIQIRIRAASRSNDRIRVYADGVRALEKLAKDVGPQYQQDVCEALARAGRTLYQLGAITEAKHAFAIAYQVGRPRFPEQSPAYRMIAASCGPMFAERVGRTYRAALPPTARGYLRFARA